MTVLTKVESAIEIGIGDFFKLVQAVGATPEQAIGAIVGFITGGPAAAEKSLLAELTTAYNNPAEIATLVKQVEATFPTLPPAVVSILNTLESLATAAAANPAEMTAFVAAIDAIEKQLGI